MAPLPLILTDSLTPPQLYMPPIFKKFPSFFYRHATPASSIEGLSVHTEGPLFEHPWTNARLPGLHIRFPRLCRLPQNTDD
jgi:hypothetical protein